MHNVLIIEDDKCIAQNQLRFFESVENFQVVGISYSIQEARAQLRTLKPALVLLDLHLPDGTGLELLTEIRKDYLETDVIIITAAKEVNSLQSAIRSGVFDYIIKPMPFNRLMDTLNAYDKYIRQKKQQEANQGSVEFDQNFVDRLLGKGQRQQHSVTLPKGVDNSTLKTIKAYLSERAGEAYNAQQLGEVLGLSRTTTRRYLEYLVSQNEVETRQVYGTRGRPERKYTYVSRSD